MISKLPGRHNVSNMLAVLAVASSIGLSHEQVQEGLLTFQGVKRRQDVLGESKGILVIDDFAHHPTAVAGTIEAIKEFYPHRRVLAVFEPRTNTSRRRIFQQQYVTAFDQADVVCIKQPSDMETLPLEERLDTERLVHDISGRGKEALIFENTEALLHHLLKNCRSGDVVLCMSNGSFDNLPSRLLNELSDRAYSLKDLK